MAYEMEVQSSEVFPAYREICVPGAEIVLLYFKLCCVTNKIDDQLASFCKDCGRSIQHMNPERPGVPSLVPEWLRGIDWSK